MNSFWQLDLLWSKEKSRHICWRASSLMKMNLVKIKGRRIFADTNLTEKWRERGACIWWRCLCRGSQGIRSAPIVMPKAVRGWCQHRQQRVCLCQLPSPTSLSLSVSRDLQNPQGFEDPTTQVFPRGSWCSRPGSGALGCSCSGGTAWGVMRGTTKEAAPTRQVLPPGLLGQKRPELRAHPREPTTLALWWSECRGPWSVWTTLRAGVLNASSSEFSTLYQFLLFAPPNNPVCCWGNTLWKNKWHG